MEVKMKTQICKYLSEIVSDVSAEELEGLIEIPPEEKLGDYALPCFNKMRKKRIAYKERHKTGTCRGEVSQSYREVFIV